MFHIHLARRSKSLILVPAFAPLTHKTIRRIVLFNRSCLPKGSNPLSATQKAHIYRDSARLRYPKLEEYSSRFSTAAQSCAFASSSTGCAQARTPSCLSGARVRLNTFFSKQKRHPTVSFLFGGERGNYECFTFILLGDPNL